MEHKVTIIVKTDNIYEVQSLLKENICYSSSISIQQETSSAPRSLSLEVTELALVISTSAGLLTAIGQILSSYFRERKGYLEIKKSNGSTIKINAPTKKIDAIFDKVINSIEHK